MRLHIPSYIVLIIISLVILALGLTAATVNPIFEYQRTAIANGQFWRLITGHWVHLNLVHTLLNLAGLWLVALWVGNERRPISWLFASTIIAFAISGALYIWQKEVSYYVGLSGLLHGLLIFGLAPLCAKNNPVGWASVIAVIIKMCCEQLIPAGHGATEALIAAPVVSIAHVYGALAGALLALCWPLVRVAHAKLLNLRT